MTRVRYVVKDVDEAIPSYTAMLGFQVNIINGTGGEQILVDDPSGDAIELFQPIQPPRAHLDSIAEVAHG